MLLFVSQNEKDILMFKLLNLIIRKTYESKKTLLTSTVWLNSVKQNADNSCLRAFP